jgi:hypothetical protein
MSLKFDLLQRNDQSMFENSYADLYRYDFFESINNKYLLLSLYLILILFLHLQMKEVKIDKLPY